MSCDIGRPNGASGLVDDQALHAAGPVLEIAELQKLRHRGRQREGRQRQIDAGQPQRRLAEQEAEGEADDAGDRQCQSVIDADMFHQDRRGVGADRIERALAQRKLAAAAGQDVQRQHREAVDQQHRQLEDDEVLHEQRHQDQEAQHDQRGTSAERHRPFRNRLDDRDIDGDVLRAAERHGILGSDSIAGLLVAASCIVLMLKLASRWAGRTVRRV